MLRGSQLFNLSLVLWKPWEFHDEGSMPTVAYLWKHIGGVHGNNKGGTCVAQMSLSAFCRPRLVILVSHNFFVLSRYICKYVMYHVILFAGDLEALRAQ